MKRIVMVLALFASFAINAQREGQKKTDFSPEQIATLKTKKLTLALDLTEKQHDQVYAIILEQVNLRKSKHEEFKQLRNGGEAKLSADQKFDLKNKRLDAQLVVAKKMKSILDDEQYETWKKISARHHERNKRKMKRRDDRK